MLSQDLLMILTYTGLNFFYVLHENNMKQLPIEYNSLLMKSSN